MNTTASTPTHPQPAAGHTPGPWTILRTQTGMRYINSADGKRCLATVESLHDGKDNPARDIEREYNTSLIASAPTLHAENQSLREINAELVEALTKLSVKWDKLSAEYYRASATANERKDYAASRQLESVGVTHEVCASDLLAAIHRSAKPTAQLNQSLHAQPNGQKGGK